jgi:hypothetical protein
VSNNVIVEHTTFDMHIHLIAFVVVSTILPYGLKLALTEGLLQYLRYVLFHMLPFQQNLLLHYIMLKYG